MMIIKSVDNVRRVENNLIITITVPNHMGGWDSDPEPIQLDLMIPVELLLELQQKTQPITSEILAEQIARRQGLVS